MKNKRSVCNMCGKEIKSGDYREMEDLLRVEKNWGYFSGKDGEIHLFQLCEDCYDQLIAQFRIPITIKKQTEYV